MRTAAVMMFLAVSVSADFVRPAHDVKDKGLFEYGLGVPGSHDFPTPQAVVPVPITKLDGSTPMCDGGIPGVQHDYICCHEGCSQCGGKDCRRHGGPSLDETDCCAWAIKRNGVLCDESGTGPCLLTSDDDDDGTDEAPEPEAPPADMVALLNLHNEARCQHNADPLTWSDDVEAFATTYAQVLTSSSNCGVLAHSTSEERNGYGENLFACWGSSSCYSPEFAMSLLYDSEVDTNAVTGYGGHATQILWKSTTQLGCAVATCSDDGVPYTVLVCQYNPPGNYMNILEQEVELPSGASC